MAPVPGPAARVPATPEPDGHDWPATVTDEIVKAVDTVRDKTTGPVQKAARYVIYGLFGAVLGTALAVMLAIALVRILVVYTPDWDDKDHVWVADLIVGTLFCAAGAVAWSQRRPRSE